MRVIESKLEELIVKMARENSGWGYDRIVGALANLGYNVSNQIVGNVWKRHGIAPAPKRSQNTTWKEFIQSRLDVLAGIDFLTVEVLTWRGLVSYYVLFFIHLESRRVSLAGITQHPARTPAVTIPADRLVYCVDSTQRAIFLLPSRVPLAFLGCNLTNGVLIA